MWILENVNEPLTPLSGPAQARCVHSLGGAQHRVQRTPAHAITLLTFLSARPPSHAVAAPAPASATSSAPQEHAKRTDPRKSTEELQVLADKAGASLIALYGTLRVYSGFSNSRSSVRP